MTTVDKAIVQRAAGTHTILQSCVESLTSIFRNPVGYVKSPMFLMMWGVYASTYTTGKGALIFLSMIYCLYMFAEPL